MAGTAMVFESHNALSVKIQRMTAADTMLIALEAAEARLIEEWRAGRGGEDVLDSVSAAIEAGQGLTFWAAVKAESVPRSINFNRNIRRRCKR